jgi:hypothetical protein
MTAPAKDSINFYSKEEIRCPVCEHSFKREDLRTGRGRLIAGSLTDELRRLYEPTEKFGEVYPLVYSIMVCPNCRYAAFPQDFGAISLGTIRRIEEEKEVREKSLEKIFPDLDLEEPRNLKSGVASYHYAILSMQYFPKDLSPTIKSGLAALRAAWLSDDLNRKYPGEHFDYLSQIYYHKAWFFYTQALRYEEDGTEGIADAGFLGPDIDQNYGYDGVLYMAAQLELRYGPRDNPELRRVSLGRAKTMVGRLFGLGKASKNKPSTLLERAKKVHSAINRELKGEGG